ncbi:hypothetical protein F8154_05155 [Alkaliphilus pronyensis]|uniref:Peptidase M50 domain-containing protein n=1 Tax=Alkaliphilus pronyensis TaxID=1482732 RepID=A0A6I0F1S0_9FIRM|nr:M50 family metallopeptidase [Alkaliphilus pronyensis]KAB3535907.1 hypothetical protein F8154_05155 [Alkaliphilus pronyensis]
MENLKVGDIKLKLHRLLLPFFLFSFLFGYLREMLIIFLVVFIHEIAHLLVAKSLSITINEIELFPFGGVAKLEKDIYLEAFKEILIACAGPILNLIFFLITEFILLNHFKESYYLNFFKITNIAIGLFNLIPIYPLDGGRVLRGALSMFLSIQKSTILSIYIGKVFSIIIFTIGIYLTFFSLVNIYIAFLAIYLFYQGYKEKKITAFLLMKEIIRKKETLLSKGIMDTKHLTVYEIVNFNMLFSSFTSSKYHYVTIIDQDGTPVGTLTESQIIEGISKYGGQITLCGYLKILKRKETC